MLSSEVNGPIACGSTQSLWRPLTNLTYKFRACHLSTFNVAAIFFRGHPYIWRTTIHHDIAIPCDWRNNHKKEVKTSHVKYFMLHMYISNFKTTTDFW